VDEMTTVMYFNPPHPYDNNPDWQKPGLCRNYPANWWFPERGSNRREIEKVKAICQDCPIRVKCLEYALHHAEKFGIWGGLSVDERNAIRRTMPQQPRRTTIHVRPISHGTNAGYHAHLRRKETPCQDCVTAHRDYQRTPSEPSET
jgi:WhiB family redox-sensing transcriptional regulator